ncbi:DUF4942 domain-containing protein [Dietzia maris]|uniref:DUF4942 domain-containing protein n=1 Tax=Dietzia maris TaxID=37915 RepID=UPI0037CA390B
MFGPDFYPTPATLASDMLAKLDKSKISRVLEPSAGRGDLIDAVERRLSSFGGRKVSIDAIERDDELAAVLKSKGRAVIARDFLTFESYAQYDAILMNPPFSAGAAHLHKALDVMKRGGEVVCLLNAETIRNPYTNERKTLVAKLDALGASIEYKVGAFTDADRKSGVEVALVHVRIAATEPQSDILANLAEAKAHTDKAYDAREVVDGDPLRGAVRRYEVEAEAGLKLIDEYNALAPLLTNELVGEHRRPILTLEVDGERYGTGGTSQQFLERLRMKYWREVFATREFARMFTSATREKYQEKVAELARYEFNLANVKQVQADLAGSMLDSLDDSIVQLFESFCGQYWDEQSNNVHYFNGWKTNKAYKVNRKVITSMQAWGWYGNDYDPRRTVHDRLADVAKVFAYLDGKVYEDGPLAAALDAAGRAQQTRNIDLEHFTVTFYKKGTAHITFKRDDLLKKFNLIGSQRKGWLPPDYGEKSYSDMTAEARAVVDAFDGGEEGYSDTIARLDFYAGRSVPSLGAGV